MQKSITLSCPFCPHVTGKVIDVCKLQEKQQSNKGKARTLNEECMYIFVRTGTAVKACETIVKTENSEGEAEDQCVN